MRARTVISVGVVSILLATACGGGSSKKEAKPESSTTTADTTPVDDGAQPYDEVLALALVDLQDYWAETLPEIYGVEYTEIPESDLIAATPDNPPPPCGEEMTYADVEGNAFYCFPAEYVTWDNEKFFPELYEEYGAFVVALLLAHEWGHVAQGQAQVTGPTVLKELQADCFAGSWTRSVADGRSENLELDAAAFNQAIGGLLELRDPTGVAADDENAHGSGFDRVNSFQEGYESGAERCARFDENPPVVLEMPFSTEEEYQSGGNLPVDEILETAAVDLNEYWTSLDSTFVTIDALQPYDVNADELPTCGNEEYTKQELENTIFFCEADNYVGFDEALIEQVHEDIGDFGVATLLSFEWTLAAQKQAGLTEETIETSLQRACFTGSWAGSILNGRTAQFSLSPGDLDETVQAFIAFGDAPGDETTVGSAFDLVTALREGVFEGEETCAAYTGSL